MVPHVVISNQKIILLLVHYCNFSTILSCNVNILYAGNLICNHCERVIWPPKGLGPTSWELLLQKFFPWCLPPPLALKIFISPLVCRPMSSEGEIFGVEISLKIECFNVSHSLYIVQLWGSDWVPIWFRKLLWCWLSQTMLYGYIRMSLAFILSL